MVLTDEQIAAMFHEAYERLAPSFDYRTRMESACPWENVPENNRKLMTAVVREIRSKLSDTNGGVELACPEDTAKLLLAAHAVNILIRVNGEWIEREADWIKEALIYGT